MRRPALDAGRLETALRLTDRIYHLHERGQPYGDELRQLSDVTGVEVTVSDACGAFGSVGSEVWAHGLLLQSYPYPESLTREELVEMVSFVCEAEEPEWLGDWYLDCVAHATGCADLSDLIFYPDIFFGDDEHNDLTPSQIVDEAIKRPRRVLITPPPSEA